nr:reverse transcriptase domain-containing protein [Tanacetum cinerariifolium]
MFPPLAAHKGIGGPLIIEAEISGHAVHRIYVDEGSSMELRLLVTIGDAKHYTRAWMNFIIVRSPSPYNEIIVRLGIREIQVVPSTAHGMLKFPMKGEIVTIRSTILTPTECTTIAATPKDLAKKAEIHHENFKVAIHPNFPDQEITIGGVVSIQARTKLCTLLKRNLDIFAWQPSNMTGITRLIFKHRLNIQEGYSPMAKQVEERTAFHTSHGVYCYTKMPFGLKNDGATYQRLVDKAFDKQIGRNLEIYVDDLVIKSHIETELLRDIEETFHTFISKSAEKSLPLFKTLKKCIKKSDFHWTPDTKQAFKQLKQHLTRLPMLVAPKPKEELIMYLSASYGAINAVLMTKRDRVPTLVYFVSRALQTPELNYTSMEKLVLTLVYAAKCLRRYFQAHLIVVITNQPIKHVMSRLDVAGLLQKWNVMLGEHNITYRSQTSMKGQILVDFLIENPDEAPPEALVIETPQEPWTLFTNGSSCVDGSEYEALIASLRIATQMGVHNVHISVDSKLVVLVEVLKEKSIQEEDVVTVVEEEGPTWMTPIMEYLKDGTLPGDKKEASKLRIKARQYKLWEGVLYRQSFLKPWLRSKAMLLGYYWRTMHRDARDIIRTCNACQVHHPMPRNPQQPLTLITAPWLFYKWGIDIAGPFPEGLGNVKFLIVAMDYFTKWIEAKSVSTITIGQVKKFVWDNIVCLFSLLGEIVSNNVKHPQSNRLVERANQSLSKGIKARLNEGYKNWIEELPHVLSAHLTMIKSSHGDTPFSLTYGTKAVIPAKIGMPMYRTTIVDVVHNNQEIRLNLDILEEQRECVVIREAKKKLKMTKYYNTRVRGFTFRPGDFVYRSNKASHAMDGGKLDPK